MSFLISKFACANLATKYYASNLSNSGVRNCSIIAILSVYQKLFDSSILEGNRNFQLNGHQLITADHPWNTKRRGVCIYHKESLGVHLVKLSNLCQCIVCEVFLQNCKGYIGVVCKSQ